MFKQLHEPKELWIVPNAKHVGFDVLLGEAYEERVLNFLEKYVLTIEGGLGVGARVKNLL